MLRCREISPAGALRAIQPLLVGELEAMGVDPVQFRAPMLCPGFGRGQSTLPSADDMDWDAEGLAARRAARADADSGDGGWLLTSLLERESATRG